MKTGDRGRRAYVLAKKIWTAAEAWHVDPDAICALILGAREGGVLDQLKANPTGCMARLRTEAPEEIIRGLQAVRYARL